MPDELIPAEEVDYKKKYKTLKRKLRFLIYEQECFQEELRRTQRKLLKATRDKSFLLDRLLQYEKADDEDSDTDATASSSNGSDTEANRNGDEKKTKKKSKSNAVNQLSSVSHDQNMSSSLAIAASDQSLLTGQHISEMIGKAFAQQTNQNRLVTQSTVSPSLHSDAQSSSPSSGNQISDSTNILTKLSQADEKTTKPLRKKMKRDSDRLSKLTNHPSPKNTDEVLETSELVIDLPE
ncbi:uncharacterized protein [Antedon mediterranea]|uniref:uncharacterized protein isoform X2 n=1 Tax=Antedon mediterranea TaxID=105859 RepID=UPI003AF7FBF5